MAELLLEPHRRQDLLEFSADAAGGFAAQEPRHLHGERRGARDRAAVADNLPGGAEHGADIDPAMLAEAAVLIGDQRVDEERIDVGERRRQPPETVRRCEWTEQHAVAVHNQGAGLGIEGRELNLRDRVFQGERRGGSQQAEKCKRGEHVSAPRTRRAIPLSRPLADARGHPPPRGGRAGAQPVENSPHAGTRFRCQSSQRSGPTTSTWPTSVRARRSGRYMSSTSAAGW